VSLVKPLLAALFFNVFALPVLAQDRPQMIFPNPSISGPSVSAPPASGPAPQAPRATAPRANTTQRGASPQESLSSQGSAPRPAFTPAYEKPMLDLSEIIGSLAFLTSLCAPSGEPNAWQRRMEGLVASEGEASGISEKLMGAYNQGYVAFSTTHRQCSPAAKAAQTLLIHDAARLARMLERRYGS